MGMVMVQWKSAPFILGNQQHNLINLGQFGVFSEGSFLAMKILHYMVPEDSTAPPRGAPILRNNDYWK